MIALCLMIALLNAGSIAALAGLAAPENRARVGEIEVSGPVRDLTLSLGQAGETRIEGELLPGEHVRIAVPIPVRGAGEAEVVPTVSWPNDDSLDDPGAPSTGRGSARFLGWRPDVSRGASVSAIDRLPPGILSRPRPPVGRKEVELPWSAIALLPACFVLALAARERRRIGMLVSVVGALVVLPFSWRRGVAEPEEITVLELAAGSDLGLEVRASFGTASVEASELESTVLAVDPEGARVHWTGSFTPRSPWRARASGSSLYRLRAYDPGPARLRREENLSTRLVETWVREDGEWTARGAWEPGAPLPPPRAGPPPPGWLSAGLPQGIPVLLGRLDRGQGIAEVAWVRMTGF